MPEVALIAALEREVGGVVRGWRRSEREHGGRQFVFFEREDAVVVCGGIGAEAARRAAEAVMELYRPGKLWSVGFAGALDASLRVGDIFAPALVIDGGDGSRVGISGGSGTLVTFMSVAGAEQKKKLAHAYGADAVDMEAAAVAKVAGKHGVEFGAVKAISDEVDFEMPEMSRFVDSQGRFKTGTFTLFAILRPWLWGRVVRLARNSGKAANALGEHLHEVGRPL